MMEEKKNNMYSTDPKIRENESLKFVTDLYDNGAQFWGETDVNVTRKTFEYGWQLCEQYLQNRIRQALENTVEYIYPDNPYLCPEEKRILSDEQIEDIMENIFK